MFLIDIIKHSNKSSGVQPLETAIHCTSLYSSDQSSLPTFEQSMFNNLTMTSTYSLEDKTEKSDVTMTQLENVSSARQQEQSHAMDLTPKEQYSKLWQNMKKDSRFCWWTLYTMLLVFGWGYGECITCTDSKETRLTLPRRWSFRCCHCFPSLSRTIRNLLRRG